MYVDKIGAYKQAFDPEGLLSTIPSIAHVLIGFWAGMKMMEEKDINMRVNRLFIIGAVLIGFALAGKVDEFWSGTGSGLFVVGILQLLRTHRLQKNAAYREKMEIEISDERNQFLRSKAWAWTGYLFILIAGSAVIVLRIFGQALLSMAASYAVCLILVLYWISYYVLKRKY